LRPDPGAVGMRDCRYEIGTVPPKSGWLDSLVYMYMYICTCNYTLYVHVDMMYLWDAQNKCS
jgi:hypothetical protein